MPKISFEEWCNRNGLQPKYKSSMIAYMSFRRASQTQHYINKVVNKIQSQVSL